MTISKIMSMHIQKNVRRLSEILKVLEKRGFIDSSFFDGGK